MSERLVGGASIFQDLDLGEALSAEAKLRPTEGGGKHPPEAKSFGKSSAGDSKRREMPPPCDQLPHSFEVADLNCICSLWHPGSASGSDSS